MHLIWEPFLKILADVDANDVDVHDVNVHVDSDDVDVTKLKAPS